MHITLGFGKAGSVSQIDEKVSEVLIGSGAFGYLWLLFLSVCWTFPEVQWAL